MHKAASVQEIGQLSHTGSQQKAYKGIFMDEKIAGKEERQRWGEQSSLVNLGQVFTSRL